MTVSSNGMKCPNVLRTMFDRLDANGDGAIDQAEIDAMRSRMSRGGRPGGRPQEGAIPTGREKGRSGKGKGRQRTGRHGKGWFAGGKQGRGEEGIRGNKPVIEKDEVSGTWDGRFQTEGRPDERSTFTIVMRMNPQGKITGSFKSAMSEGKGDGKYDPKTNQCPPGRRNRTFNDRSDGDGSGRRRCPDRST